MKPFAPHIASIAIGIASLGAGPVSAEPLIQGVQDGKEKTATLDAIDALNDWIERSGSYSPANEPLKRIVFVEAGETILADGRKVTVEDRTRGLYDGETATIYIARPWSPDDPYDRSVLLHELVHHAQVEARHWYCPQAMEWDAYRLQQDFLAERDIEAGFYWPAILLESSCSKRDIHPD
jgi:hypothetical protein